LALQDFPEGLVLEVQVEHRELPAYQVSLVLKEVLDFKELQDRLGYLVHRVVWVLVGHREHQELLGSLAHLDLLGQPDHKGQ